MNYLYKFFKYFVSATFISLIVGLISLYYTVRGSRTHLSMDIAAESNVLDVRHPIPDLAILFQGRDIEEEKSNLKVLTVRVINDGEASIREGDFDSRTPFGLEIDGGRVVRAQVVNSNASYLSVNFHPRVDAPNRIFFDKIIFDRNKFVAVEILVIHPKNTNPRVMPLGKIAGLDEIGLTNSFQERSQPGFAEQVFAGPPAIQISRTIAYAFLALLSVVILGFSIAGVAAMPSAFKRSRRRRRARRFTQLESDEQENKRKAVAEIFIEYGLPGLHHASKLLGDEVALKKLLDIHNRFDGDGMILRPKETIVLRPLAESVVPNSVRPLVSAKLLTLKDDHLEIDPDIRQLLSEFIEQVIGQGAAEAERHVG